MDTDTKPEVQETPDDGDKRIGLAERDPSEIAKQCHAWWKESAEKTSEYRKRKKRNHEMYDGDQWEREDVQARGRRPTLTFNQLLTLIAAVEGQEKNNRQELKFYGRGGDDEANAEKWTRILKWIMDECGGEFVLSDQFKEMLKAGEGWVVPEVDYLEDPEGLISLVMVDDDEMFDDPFAKECDGTDARFRIRVKMLTQDEGVGLWGNQFTQACRDYALEKGISETDGRGYPDIYLTPEKTNGPKIHEAKDHTWAVMQCWWWEIRQGWVVRDEATGLLIEKTDEEYETLVAERAQLQSDILGQVVRGEAVLPSQDYEMGMASGLAPMVPVAAMPPPIEAEKRPIKCVYEAFVVCDTVLEVGKLKEPLKCFPAVPMRGIWRKSKCDWIGLIEPLIDAQKQMNVEQSVLVELMQLMPKSSWMGPRGSFHNKKDWETGVAQPGKILEYNARNGKPEPISPPQIPRHMMELAFSRPQTMREVSGVNVELTGIRQGNDAGVVMEQRAKAAQTVLAGIFDNARRSKKLLGKVLLAFMQTHIKPGRQIRVLGPDGAETVTINEDMLMGRYDMQVDETNHTVNDRIATLNLMQTTLPNLLTAGIPVPPEIVDLLPMDTKTRDSWKRMIMWQLTKTGALPPEGWEPGMPMPLPPLTPVPPQEG